MKAIISQLNSALGNYSAKTENNILLVFSVIGEGKLELDDAIEIDLLNILKSKKVTNISTSKEISISINKNDIHDLNLPAKHGVSRIPNKDRMSGG